ncbi:MSHA pilin protein MshC [Oceanisphaera litoralis]|uniref:prepilin-type N-terminal cleavage/methylation domain-containing protein n=1 Tax=Oceanisphaera litoralis TaxID=225144 RepID=UPI001958F729|nr:prepilin-type N-terminal cleavage/methylation domain-containing protein [Oceanisphaera litoralis]MBM7454760.1 MSHA pilin protein MshC [Oceanisphaera litoralis]
MIRFRGFTLIELILVLVLSGILAAVALPRLQLGSRFEQRLQADNLVGLLRLAQLRAMNDPEAVQSGADLRRCSRVVITNTAFSLTQHCESTATPLADDVLDKGTHQGLFMGSRDLNIQANRSLPLVLQFGKASTDTRFLSEDSRLGRPFINDIPLAESLEITIGGKAVHIEPEGYIHAP